MPKERERVSALVSWLKEEKDKNVPINKVISLGHDQFKTPFGTYWVLTEDEAYEQEVIEIESLIDEMGYENFCDFTRIDSDDYIDFDYREIDYEGIADWSIRNYDYHLLAYEDGVTNEYTDARHNYWLIFRVE